MDDYNHNKRSKSGQIPAFGEWDYANELPITQYFECARQAGLIRFSSSSGETADQACPRPHLYAPVHHHHHLNNSNPLRKAIRGGGGGREKRGPRAHVMEQKKQQAKVCDVTQPPPNKHHQYHKQPNPTHEDKDKDKDKDGTVSRPRRLPTTTTTRPPKPVDEDLYKIPPELLHTTKRKKMLRFVSCLVPACAS